jgi:hypothetical protein
MKQKSLTTVAIAASTFACAALLSFGWSEQGGVSLSVESAQARVGRPLTPVSVAGVARRQNRRAAYRYDAAGIAGPMAVNYAGIAAAAGTAAVVGAATSPGWGWGGNPYYSGTGYYGGRGALGARAAYYGGAPYAAATSDGQPWSLWAAYHADGPWYGFSGWPDYKARGGIVCDPGTLVKGDNGLMYHCQ